MKEITATAPVAHAFTGESPNPLFRTICRNDKALLFLALPTTKFPFFFATVAAGVETNGARGALSGMACILAIMTSTIEFPPACLTARELGRSWNALSVHAKI